MANNVRGKDSVVSYGITNGNISTVVTINKQHSFVFIITIGILMFFIGIGSTLLFLHVQSGNKNINVQNAKVYIGKNGGTYLLGRDGRKKYIDRVKGMELYRSQQKKEKTYFQ